MSCEPSALSFVTKAFCCVLLAWFGCNELVVVGKSSELVAPAM